MEPVREDEMKAYEPTMRERIASGLQSAFESLGANRYKARQRAQTITGGQSSNLPLGMGVADVVSAVSLPATMAMAPIYAEEGIRDIKSAGQAAGRGDYVGAGVEGLFGALNLLPAVSGVTGLARRAIGQPIKPPEIPDTPRITESPYETAQEGPFYRVKPRFAQEAGPKARGIREEVPAEPVGGPAGGDVPQPAQIDAKALIADPTNFVRRAADDYSQRALGKPYELPKMPKAALAKQSGIGRTFQLAASDDPGYKRAVFEAYGRQFPDIVEATGAQNYDQLMEAAYRQLAKETKDQFDTLPINMSFYRGGEGAYENSPQMLQDVYGNRHMYVYQGGQPHDFLNAVDPNTGLNANEMFRAVHDFYGHAVHGNPFGPKGEEIAYGAHSQMFSPLARMAMASETRGQNSFVNFTPLNAELMQRINRMNGVRYEAKRARDQKTVAEMDALLREAWGGFQFAPQKSLLLPPEYVDPQFTGGVPSYIQPLIKPEPGTTTAERLTHFSQSPELEALDPRRYGTGIAGEEMGRLKYTQNPVMERSYFYTGENPRPEPGLGPYRYGAESQGLYNLEEDPVRLRTLAAEANRTPYTSPYNQGITDPGQTITDIERMAKEYGYEGIVNPQQRTAVMFNPTPVQRYQRGGAVKEKVKEGVRGALERIQPMVNRLNMSFKDVTKRVPELTQAAQALTRGELTAEDYDRLVQLYKPVTPYDFVPEPARPEDALRALTENKRPMFGKTDEIQPGERADLRLDIPAYRDHGVWVNSIHRKDAPTVYGSVSSVRNAQMIGSPDKALKVATGETPKAPFAVIRGEWNPMSEEEAVRAAQQYLNHPDWRQVGYDPERHGYFYDRATMQPILGAEEVIQIGPLVLARKPQLGAKSEQKYQSGGLSTAMRRK